MPELGKNSWINNRDETAFDKAIYCILKPLVVVSTLILAPLIFLVGSVFIGTCIVVRRFL